MGVGFKVGGAGAFKSFILVTGNVGETITATHPTDSKHKYTGVVTSNGTVTLTVKKKGNYSLSSTDGATATCNVDHTNEVFNATVKWTSTITATANSNKLVTAKLGNYTVSGTTGSSGTTNTVVLTVHKKGSYSVTSADGSSATASVATNGGNVAVDVILLSYITVTANSGIQVTATSDGYTYTGTTGSSGTTNSVKLHVRHLGTYTITSADGASTTVKVSADGSTYTANVVFSATITVTANANISVTATLGTYTVTRTTSGTGTVSIPVTKAGSYTVTSADGASATVSNVTNGSTKTANVVMSATLTVTANSGIKVTATCGSYKYEGTTGSSGTTNTVEFTVKKAGTYTVTTADGASGSVAVADGQTKTISVIFVATIRASANSGIKVTAKLNDSYSKSGTVASGATSVDIEVRKAGTYTVTSADGASGSVTVANGQTKTIDVILKSYIKVTGYASHAVTATLGSYSVSDTTNSSGVVTLTVIKLGTYTVTSADGSSTTCKVEKDGTTYNATVKWSSTVNIQANPGSTITLTNGSITYTKTANSTTGLAAFTVKHNGTYTVTTSNGANSNAENNTSSVNASTNGGTVSGRMIKINVPASISSANYSTNAITVYWTKPSSNWTGINLRRATGSAPSSRTAGTSLYTGAGNSIALTSSGNVTGYTNTGLTSGTTYYYSAFSYITINGTSYYSTTYRTTSKAAASYTGTTQTITATGTWTVPTGWRKVKVFCVGGGGGGGAGNYAGGGGGGYTATSAEKTVTPGTSYTATIGAGGTGSTADGGRGGTTSLGSLCSASGGYGGTHAAQSDGYVNSGGNGGSGGGAMSPAGDGSLKDDGGKGGSDGGYGYGKQYRGDGAEYLGGVGQNRTTRAFAETSGTLYAGGGGGGGRDNGGTLGGDGGSGGGGHGANYAGDPGGPGTANTGGGGGGGRVSQKTTGGNGGSGIILVRCTG